MSSLSGAIALSFEDDDIDQATAAALGQTAVRGADTMRDAREDGVLGAGPRDSLRLLTCGSVDDGKSTLIGRLLWDASDLAEDQRAQLMTGQLAANGQPDFSRLVDGLAAEREQGITIDIAWRFFDTGHRRYVIIDSPGHEQYTRNMASGASHADVAILLTDARHGIKRQTRRHAAILDLMGVKRVILAVNKMDLVDFDEARFREIADGFDTLVRRFGFVDAVAIPVAALGGDNVAEPSRRMPWYDGPTLIAALDSMPARVQDADGAFRFPVQMVVRDGQDFRGLAGTVAAGRIGVGDPIVDVLSGRTAKVARIATMDGDLPAAVRGQAVVIGLDRDLDIARGAVLASGHVPASPARRFSARLVWLSEDPFDVDQRYLLRTATDLIPIDGLEIESLFDLETLDTSARSLCVMNDIALTRICLGRPAVLDSFDGAGSVGNFMIVNAVTGASVAGGVVCEIAEAAAAGAGSGGRTAERGVLVLDDALLAAGLCADLGVSPADRAEFKRRAREVIRILEGGGLPFENRLDVA